MWKQQTDGLLQEKNHFSVLTFIPLLFCTTCHMWVSTRLWGAGGCWGWSDGLRGAAAKAPTVFRLWSGAHTQFMITWDGDGRRMTNVHHLSLACFPHLLQLQIQGLFKDFPDQVPSNSRAQQGIG